MTTAAALTPTGAGMRHYDPAREMSEQAMVRKLPPMEDAPPTPQRTQAALVTALRSHAEERSVYETTMEKERQRQRKALLERMRQGSAEQPRGSSAPSSSQPTEPVPGGAAGDAAPEEAGAAAEPGESERHALIRRVAELEAALQVALAERLAGASATPRTPRADLVSTLTSPFHIGTVSTSTSPLREPEPEPEPEPAYDAEPDPATCVAFSAEHRHWRDTLTLAEDGRFWRSGRDRGWSKGSTTAGLWRFRGAQLTLAWFTRPSEYLQTVDHGRSFVGKCDGGNFKMSLPREEEPGPWLCSSHSLESFEPGCRVHILTVPAVKAAVSASEAISGWTLAREERCDMCGEVSDTDADGTVNVSFEDGFSVWLPFEALEMESEYLERSAVEETIAAAKAAAAEEALRLELEQEELRMLQLQQLQLQEQQRQEQAGEARTQETQTDDAQGSADGAADSIPLDDPLRWRAVAAAAVPLHGKHAAMAMLSEHIVVIKDCVAKLHAASEAEEAEVLEALRSQPTADDADEVSAAARGGLLAASDTAPPGTVPADIVPKGGGQLELSPLPAAKIVADDRKTLVLAVGGSDEHAQDVAEIHAMHWDVDLPGGQGYWRELAHARLPFTRRHAAICALADGSIMVIGGMDVSDKTGLGRGAARPELVGLAEMDMAGGGSNVNGTDSGRVDVFGLMPGGKSGEGMKLGWKQLKSMPTRRRSCQAVALPDGRVLALGGAVYPGGREKNHPVLRTVESWCPSLLGGQDGNGWAEQPEMLEPRENFGACCVQLAGGGTDGSPRNGFDGFRVVVAGGATNMGMVLRTAECFDGLSWSALPPMREPREGCSCAALPDARLVVAGGCGASVELYDFDEGAWTALAPMRLGRSFCGMCFAHGHLFVGGGVATDWTSHASVEVLDVGLVKCGVAAGRPVSGGVKKSLVRRVSPLSTAVANVAASSGSGSSDSTFSSRDGNFSISEKAWVEQWLKMSEEERESLKVAEKKRYKTEFHGTSRGFTKMWDEKLRAVANYKGGGSTAAKLRAVSAMSAVSAFQRPKTPVQLDAIEEPPSRSLSPVDSAWARAQASSGRGREGTRRRRLSKGSLEPVPTPEPGKPDLSERKWRPAAAMTQPRRWLQLVAAAVPEKPATPPAKKPKPKTPPNELPSAADLKPVAKPRSQMTAEEAAELVAKLAPRQEEKKPPAPSAGFGIFG